MSYMVTITYSAANDIYNIDKQTPNLKTVAPIPGLSSSTMPGKWKGPSKEYLYAADGATAPEYLKENLFTQAAGALTGNANLSLLTSSQKRWPESTAMDLMNILQAYLIPQIPIYRAWQTFKMTADLDGATNTFACDTYAEASFYIEAGKALKDYGFAVTSAENPSITLDKTVLSLVKGTTGTLTAIATPATATVNWDSSDSGVATVSDGEITAGSSAGSCTITASITIDGVTYSAECALTVTAS